LFHHSSHLHINTPCLALSKDLSKASAVISPPPSLFLYDSQLLPFVRQLLKPTCCNLSFYLYNSYILSLSLSAHCFRLHCTSPLSQAFKLARLLIILLSLKPINTAYSCLQECSLRPSLFILSTFHLNSQVQATTYATMV
jgi:hypothetical protein